MGVRSAGDRLAGSATSASSSSSSGSTSPNHTRLFLNAPANYLTYLPSHRLPLSSGRGSGLPTGLPAPVGGSAQHLRTSALGGAGNTMAAPAAEVTARVPATTVCPGLRVAIGGGAPIMAPPPAGSPGHPPGVPRTPPDPPGHP